MTSSDVGVFLIRLVVGGFFAAHGCQLLFGWFGGGGLLRTRQRFQALGFRPGWLFAPVAAATELISGAGVVLGLAWPVPALLALGPMTVAIVRVHWPRIWVTESGIEYPLVIATVMAGIGLLDAGRLSIDHALAIDLPQQRLYWLVLLGALGGAGTSLIRARIISSRTEPESSSVQGSGAVPRQ